RGQRPGDERVERMSRISDERGNRRRRLGRELLRRQRRQYVPGGEDRVEPLGGVEEIRLPAPGYDGVEVPRAHDLVEQLVGQLLHVQQGQQVFRRLAAQAIRGLVALRLESGVQLLHALVQLGFICAIGVC